jgi:hypothetical protein
MVFYRPARKIAAESKEVSFVWLFYKIFISGLENF